MRARAEAGGGSGEETSGSSGSGSPEVLGSAKMEGVGSRASRSPILEADSDKSGPVSSYLIGSSVTRPQATFLPAASLAPNLEDRFRFRSLAAACSFKADLRGSWHP